MLALVTLGDCPRSLLAHLLHKERASCLPNPSAQLTSRAGLENIDNSEVSEAESD